MTGVMIQIVWLTIVTTIGFIFVVARLDKIIKTLKKED